MHPLAALTDNKRGRKPLPENPLNAEVERLRRENQRLSRRLEQAELIIDIQKNRLRDSSRPIGQETKGTTLSGIRTVVVGLLEVFPRKKT